ncbi:MAG: hypothetical protein NXI21_00855 [Alphaproteobacteria bacterium]|nr:hypothetical protein [Alphaproteobacteria bacterium]
MAPRPLSRRAALVAALAAAVAAPIALSAAPARAEKVNQSFLGGVAIEGYDPVAYLKQGRPVEGSSDFTTQWNGAVWRFASAENRDAFSAAPETYAPAYGGYCAWAVSQGYTASIDPDAWKIVDGRLYLNYNKSIQQRWEQDVPGNIAKGDANWPEIEAGL